MTIKQIYEAGVFEQTDGTHSYRCSCGARGGSYLMATGSQYGTAEHAMDQHVEKIHVQNPMRRAREESLEIPDANRHTDTTDVVQQHIPGDVEIPGHAPTQCPNDTTPPLIVLIPPGKHQARIYTNRWELFTDKELEYLFGDPSDTGLWQNNELLDEGVKALENRGLPTPEDK